MSIGFTIGKFAPFHSGHKYLISRAISEMDEFNLVVCDTTKLNIEIDSKIKWKQTKFPFYYILL